FRLAGGRAEVNRFLHAARHIPFAPTLGDVGTTLSHPASSSHRGLSEAARAALGITEGFVRVSVGVEDIGLLKREFAQAVAASRAG
ncbi:MAG TPA: PLP-dependent transferase, partial [Thermohalobaculum sp.]|nr:PLP-dependent transferase [Thermohalobaculum sp.]